MATLRDPYYQDYSYGGYDAGAYDPTFSGYDTQYAGPPDAGPQTDPSTDFSPDPGIAPTQPPSTRLLEGDPEKLSNPDYANTSPKYAFMQAANSGKYGYRDLPGMLLDLQTQFPDFYQGWMVQDDKLRYTGDPSKLNDAWNGYTEFDVVKDWDNPQGWQWLTNQDDGIDHGNDRGGSGMSFPTMSFPAGASGGGPSYGGPPPSAPSTRMDQSAIRKYLDSLISGGEGGLNEDLINRRLDSARGQLERDRRGRMDWQDAILAERGLIGSGPEGTAIGRLNQDLADEYSNTVQSIYGDEMANADARLIAALQLEAGLTSDEARLAVERYKADIGRELGLGELDLGRTRASNDFTLGQGNLALGNTRAGMDWNRFLAEHDLNREAFGASRQDASTNQWLTLLDLMLRGAGVGAGGYI